jgi:hypothetical protein
MPSVLPQRSDVTSKDALPERHDVGDALGPIAAGLLVATMGYARMFQILAVVGLTMALVFSQASRSRSTTDFPQAA